MFFIISWKMTLFTLGVMLPSMLFGPIYGRFSKKIQKDISDAKAASSNIAEEAFSNIRTVKAFANEDAECREYSEKNNIIYLLSAKAAFWYGGF